MRQVPPRRCVSVRRRARCQLRRRILFSPTSLSQRILQVLISNHVQLDSLFRRMQSRAGRLVHIGPYLQVALEGG